MTRESNCVAFVVDDEDVIASTLALILRTDGFDARPFADPLDALSAADSIRPILLVTDVCMPGINGVELAIQLTKRYPDCKVLLFSGQANTADLFGNAKVIGYDFPLLTKPVHPRTLLETIKGLFETAKPIQGSG